jgi:hypothetical protein
MSSNGEKYPEIKLNDVRMVTSEDEDSFDKKLEEMKAEIEELEQDFSHQTLDQLVRQSFGSASVRDSDNKVGELDDHFTKDSPLSRNELVPLGKSRKKSMLSAPVEKLAR